MNDISKALAAIVGLILLIWILSLAGCGGGGGDPTYQVESDNEFKYRAILTPIPVDATVYYIAGIVGGAPGAVVRQTQAASGSLAMYDGTGSGSYSGPEFGGKNVVRLYVTLAEPATALAPPGATILLKAVDIKAAGLEAGDYAQFLCRADTEVISPARNNEPFNPETMLTYELDDCRLKTGVVRAETGR